GRGGRGLPRRDGQGDAQAQAARRDLPGGPDRQVADGALPAAAQGGQGAVRRAGEEEQPRRAGCPTGDDAPGQGPGVPRDAAGRGQQRGRADACGLSGGRPDRQGRTRGAGAVPVVRGGDPGQGLPGRHGPRNPEPVPGETARRHLKWTSTMNSPVPLPLVPDPSSQALRISPTDVSQFVRLEQFERYLRFRLAERFGRTFMREYEVTPQRITPLLSLSGREFEDSVEQNIAKAHGTVQYADRTNLEVDRPVNNDAVVEEARKLPP